MNNLKYKINLGCGNRWAPGWQNVDGNPLALLARLRALRIFNLFLPKVCFRYPHDIIVANLRRIPLPFADNTASVIFSGYTLEYINQDECHRLLNECYRILTPGGLIRLCQTDIEMIVKFYAEKSKVVEGQAAIEIASTFLRLATPQHTELPVRLFRRGGVQQLFDRKSISTYLTKAGFINITFYNALDGCCPDLEIIERPERKIAPFLYVEATKPV